MRTDEKTESLMREKTGLVAIKKEDGLRTFETALMSDADQIGVFKGEKEKIRNVMGLRPPVSESASFNDELPGEADRISEDIDAMTQAEAEKILETELDELKKLIETEI